MDLNIYKTSAAKEKEGVWRNLTGDAKVKVARSNNPAYRAAMVKYYKEFVPPGIKAEDAPDEIEKATIYAMADAILVGWENLTIGGEDLEYNTENARMVLTDYPDFREVISTMCQEREPYSPDDIAEK